MDPTISEINSITQYEIYPKSVQDEFFLASPLLAYWRDHCLVPFTGGTFMQSPFRYAPLIGGFYAPGADFNITKRTTIAAMQFNARYMYVSIPEYLEEILVVNKGENAVVSLLEADMANGVDTINAITAVNSNLSGQGTRTLAINGWPEAINDGITPSYDGTIYTSYGQQARNGAISAALNSVPLWCGDAAGNPAPPNYLEFEMAYQDACIGRKEPNLGVGNKAIVAGIKSVMQVQQRFAQERDPVWGVTGFRFNNAMILKDDYFPSLRYGKNDPVLGNYLTGSFVSPGTTANGGTAAAISNLPVSGVTGFRFNNAMILKDDYFPSLRYGKNDPVLGNCLTGSFVSPGTTANGGTAAAISNLPVSGVTCTVGEVFCFFNTFDWLFRISDSEQFGYGFSGFVPAQDNTRVVGQIKAMVNMQNLSPRTQKQMYGLQG